MTSRRMIAFALFGVIGLAILISLGVWQVQRLGEKQALIARIEARLAASPVSIPAGPDPVRDRLLRVTASGHLGQEELHFISSLRPFGPGYRIVAPFTLADGRRVMADLGYVPQRMKDPGTRPQATGSTEITGVLRWPRETDGFTPEPDTARNIWFAREVGAMAEALGTEPVLIVAQSHDLGEWPRPVPPGANVRNNHLDYALTWFGLAIAWVVVSALLIRTELRKRRSPRGQGGA